MFLGTLTLLSADRSASTKLSRPAQRFGPLQVGVEAEEAQPQEAETGRADQRTIADTKADFGKPARTTSAVPEVDRGEEFAMPFAQFLALNLLLLAIIGLSVAAILIPQW